MREERLIRHLARGLDPEYRKQPGVQPAYTYALLGLIVAAALEQEVGPVAKTRMRSATGPGVRLAPTVTVRPRVRARWLAFAVWLLLLVAVATVLAVGLMAGGGR